MSLLHDSFNLNKESILKEVEESLSDMEFLIFDKMFGMICEGIFGFLLQGRNGGFVTCKSSTCKAKVVTSKDYGEYGAFRRKAESGTMNFSFSYLRYASNATQRKGI